MFEKIIETNAPEETYEVGKQIGENVKAGEIYCLSGDLGVGKTYLSKGIAKGMGIEDEVNSPTFTIVCEYEGGKMPLYHFDVYRLSDSYEMDELGYEEYFFGEGICLVEWAEIVRDIIPDDATWITIEKDFSKGSDYRKITITKR